MWIFFQILLFGFCYQGASSCTICEYGVAAKDSGGVSIRFLDTNDSAITMLDNLVRAGFDELPAYDACYSYNVCGSHSICVNLTERIFNCDCEQYYVANVQATSFACVDVDECLIAMDNNCSNNATCTNQSPGFSCSCVAGFTGDGVNCTDIPECASSPCATNATCDEPRIDNYTCTCISGYTGDPYVSCTDIDECVGGTDNCHDNATCTNSDASFSCACDPGYFGNGTHCEDINECDSNPCAVNATCSEPIINNYTCACDPGFVGDGFANCTDIQECSSQPCATNATCDDSKINNYTCTCVPGYSGDPYTNCSDIDECTDGSHNCHGNATCSNSDTSFSCACDFGFSGNGTYCEDIDECASNPCFPNATCSQPTPGNFSCACFAGYDGDGVTNCTRARQSINIAFVVTCDNLTFTTDLEDDSSVEYRKVTDALHTSFEAFVTSVDALSGVQNVTYNFVNSSDGLGYAQTEIMLVINNTNLLVTDFEPRVGEISENVECKAVASTDECAYGLDDCDPSRRCVDSDYGFCCYYDFTYLASIVLNATYNASIHSDVLHPNSQSLCNDISDLATAQLDAIEHRGCTQAVTGDCRKLIDGSVEAVLQLTIVNATYTTTDITAQLQLLANQTTIWGTVISAGDFNECSDDYEVERNCSAFADCLNFIGNFTCSCNASTFDNGTVPGKICVSPVTVNCTDSNISVSIVEEYYLNQGIALDSLRLADGSCNRTTHSAQVGDSIEFTVSFNDCKTTLSTSSDNSTIVASNYVTNRPLSGVFTGVEIVVPFECKLPSSVNITSLFSGAVAEVRLPSVASVSGFTLVFKMFNENFLTPYGPSHTFSSNELVYGQISISNSIDAVSVYMARCWGTPTADRTDSEYFEYISGGCSNDHATSFDMISNGNGSARFSFQMFLFRQVNAVYLHCDVLVCPSLCIPSCWNNRGKRDTPERTEEVTITIKLALDPNDPQYYVEVPYVNGSSSDPTVYNIPERPPEPTVHDIWLPIVTGVLAFVLILLLALLVIMVVRKRKASKDASDDSMHMNSHAVGVNPPAY